jgi:hypothetical protein
MIEKIKTQRLCSSRVIDKPVCRRLPEKNKDANMVSLHFTKKIESGMNTGVSIKNTAKRRNSIFAVL